MSSLSITSSSTVCPAGYAQQIHYYFCISFKKHFAVCVHCQLPWGVGVAKAHRKCKLLRNVENTFTSKTNRTAPTVFRNSLPGGVKSFLTQHDTLRYDM